MHIVQQTERETGWTEVMNAVIKLFQLQRGLFLCQYKGNNLSPLIGPVSFSPRSLWSASILPWCVLFNSESGAILMLLYLATAPLLPPCLKIAVNYKCSLNVSSDPEMQVWVRRRGLSISKFKKCETLFLPLLRVISPSSIFSYNPLLLLCLLHSLPSDLVSSFL